ncbi:SigE family RNA polymerase sigma factor [Streptomyces sp. BE20]|uniref:SigE family RNA polymerase sigma factor n=1 Tax=Streptomycetaceae TaxID=2062 RepID=UPI002E759E1C|nr:MULTISPECIES: SigE family RNA polymerase sigma factor [unclassified Streptomyces]MED7949693.1 SigE family RNA polymerase sigma factor [Streptomyces sp. BE303]MEE1825543.1 SigE family RNA polymerase sigma factor [Streptomyces sp. BE20]
MDRAGDFEEFAANRAGRLFQVAYLMCGDWHQAQDLVQTTLAKLYSVWGRLRRGDDEPSIDAYARKVLLRCYLSHRRLRRSGEIAVAELPDTPVRPDDHPANGSELRLTLVAALRTLPPRNRAVVVLRYLEDHPIEAVAEMLGTTPAAVKGLSTRSLARLREILADDRELLFRP